MKVDSSVLRALGAMVFVLGLLLGSFLENAFQYVKGDSPIEQGILAVSCLSALVVGIILFSEDS